ncbi:hypothetical protein O6H91_06G071800 [Diphasiastrum complanatum]|uniref:Uncharacterized protein n=1 Tax=Diphasiastrum complanatum TaxID=34168 RepID=A0ACC2DEZ7_DIPCM|nr:hypothetical protein O6H91_06G071800 [Diphasiastrum complanatum]
MLCQFDSLPFLDRSYLNSLVGFHFLYVKYEVNSKKKRCTKIIEVHDVCSWLCFLYNLHWVNNYKSLFGVHNSSSEKHIVESLYLLYIGFEYTTRQVRSTLWSLHSLPNAKSQMSLSQMTIYFTRHFTVRLHKITHSQS